MTRRSKLGAMVGLLGAGLFGSACAADVRGHAGLTGRWGGFLDIGPGLRLVLEIAPDQPVVLVSVDQGNGRIPATAGTCTATGLDVTFGSVRASLKLSLNAAGLLVGEFKQGAARAIEFKRLAVGEAPARPAAAAFTDLQTEVNTQREKAGAPALSAVSLSKSGQQLVTNEAVSGVLVQGQSSPVTKGLKWHVGSITKSMTATLVARLVERGLIRWDVKLSEAFGDMAPDMLPVYGDVTLSQLMTGRSGLPTNISTGDLFGHAAGEETPTQRRRIWVNQALKMRPENAPGAGFVYPNNGYVLAGALCEKVTGKPYETLMAEEVFGPLGLTSAGFGPPVLGNPQGHRRAVLGGRILPVGVDSGADNPAPMGPAGRAHMTLLDLAKFGLAHSEGHQGQRNSYLRQETWQFLHTPPVRTGGGNDYAYGWVARADDTLWHNGSNTYWLAELAFDPRVSKAASACANIAGTEQAVGRVLAAGLV